MSPLPAPHAPQASPVKPLLVWLLLIVLGILVGGSLFLSIQRIKNHNLALLEEGARNVFRTIIAARKWNASSGGVYVPISEANPSNPYLLDAPRDLHTVEGLRLTQINPAYMTRQIARATAADSSLMVHMTSLRVLRPENAPDAWERGKLLLLEEGAREFSEIIREPSGTETFRFIAPLIAEKACLSCHQTYAEGSVRGGISISQPYSPSNIQSQILHSAGLHLLAFLLLSSGAWFALRALRQHMEQTRQAMEGLLQSEKMASLGRLVAGFAHELNTPLGVAISALSHTDANLSELETLLQQGEGGQQDAAILLSELQEASKLAQRNLHRAADLVAGFKRSSTDLELEDVRNFSLRELIENVLQTLRNVYKYKAQIELDCPEELHMRSVPGLLDQVFTNLIVNSSIHAFGPDRHDGQIRITAESGGANSILISYADDGVGMTPEVLQRAFEPFFTTQPSSGSGLGLYICYSLITTRLGGEIRCDSLPGGGTHFLIRLPQHPPGQHIDEAP